MAEFGTFFIRFVPSSFRHFSKPVREERRENEKKKRNNSVKSKKSFKVMSMSDQTKLQASSTETLMPERSEKVIQAAYETPVGKIYGRKQSIIHRDSKLSDSSQNGVLGMKIDRITPDSIGGSGNRVTWGDLTQDKSGDVGRVRARRIDRPSEPLKIRTSTKSLKNVQSLDSPSYLSKNLI